MAEDQQRLLSSDEEYFPKGGRLRSRVSRTSFAEIHDTDTPTPHLEYAEASSISSVINLTNTIVGGGVLGLPFAVGSCGFVLGSCLLIGAAALTIFSCHLLIHCASKINYPKSFYHVAEASVPQFTFLIDLALVLLCFGVGASYLIVIGGLMPDVMDQMGMGGIWNDRSTWIVIGTKLSVYFSSLCFYCHMFVFNIYESLYIDNIFAGFCIVTPLSSLKQLDALKWTSAISILFVFFIAAVVFFYSVGLPDLDPCKDADDDDGDCVGDRVATTVTIDTVRVFGIFIFAYTCQTVHIHTLNYIVFGCSF